MNVTFLGTGTSHGVPPIDCVIRGYTSCPKNVCRESETDPKHRRTRSSIVVEFEGKTVLIDVSLDFREQMLREKLSSIDAVLITHSHADHIGGIPDLRSYTRGRRLRMLGSPQSLSDIRKAYRYIFERPKNEGGGIPDIDVEEVSAQFELFGRTIVPIPVEHGSAEGCVGYRIGSMAYLPDLKQLLPGSIEYLLDLDLLIIDALRDTRPHGTHMILPESISLSRRLRAKKTVFIYFCYDIHYLRDAYLLPDGMAFAYDGMKLIV
jgi:phosphoribosyl 1,2-cyclic phosphate phosphodiesterase